MEGAFHKSIRATSFVDARRQWQRPDAARKRRYQSTYLGFEIIAIAENSAHDAKKTKVDNMGLRAKAEERVRM
jgi:hypothetical protein